MDPRQLFADERHALMCASCGNGDCSTADHVPSKVLLDEPYPENLPVVQACARCNNGFSADERYLACLIGVVISGTTDPSTQARTRIGRILSEQSLLRQALEASRKVDESGTVRYYVDSTRVANVIVKLARGHAAYELSEPQLEPPRYVRFQPLTTMGATQRTAFETPNDSGIWPEIGSRAFIVASRAFAGVDLGQGWRMIQPGRYRYLVGSSPAVQVRFVLSEYLACDVGW